MPRMVGKRVQFDNDTWEAVEAAETASDQNALQP
jgi:hypothetical protein